MFRRYPYWGWLILSLMVWGIAWLRFHHFSEKMKPGSMAAAVQQELLRQEENFNLLMQDTQLIRRIFSEDLQDEDIARLTALPYRLFAYNRNSELVFWNTNKVLDDCSYLNNEHGTSILKNERGNYLKKCIKPKGIGQGKTLVVLFPVVKLYSFENSYLKSSFVAADYIPVATRITSKPAIGSYAIKTIDEKPVFYLHFSNADTPDWKPDTIMYWIIAIALLITIGWVQLITIKITRQGSFWLGLSLTILFIVVFRTVTYQYGYPFNLGNLKLFSPLLYASSNFLRSLGDLLINAICYLWLVIFLLRNISYTSFRNIKLNSLAKLFLASGIIIVVIIYAFGFINIVRSLVLDSNIAFDVSHFYSISSYTVLGLVTICIITGASWLLIYIINIFLRSLIKNIWIKYVIIIVAGILLVAVSDKETTGPFSYFMLAWLLLFIALLDVRKLVNIKDVLSPQTVFWGIFLCVFCTAILQYFNYKKEHETRKRFAEKVVYQKDELTVYAFRNISQSIQRDRQIKSFFDKPTYNSRRNLNERFDALYLGGQLNKYQSRLLFFDSSGKALYNSDTISYPSLTAQVEKAEPTIDSTLFYKEFAQNGHYYLAKIPIPADADSPAIIGYVFIDLAVKEAESESVYPELLQPGNVEANTNEAGYSYAVYIDRKLLTQTNDYAFSFPVYLLDTVTSVYKFFEWGNSSELWYKADDKKTVLVIFFNKRYIQAITLFSYLFGIQMLIVFLVVSYRTYLSYFSKPHAPDKFINFTLRKRIHFSMLGIVFICFIIIGIVTIVFFNYQYSQSNKTKVRKTMQAVERSVVQYMRSQGSVENTAEFNELISTPSFNYFISNLATIQKVDINVYNASGILKVTSQENIYDKALLARIIMPDAYYNLFRKSSSLFIQNEKIGKLSYLSSYAPIRDQSGLTVGYINVPFFASEKELNYQISNIVVALINLYAFIFLISGLLTVFITQWITRTFNIVIDRFDKLTLTKNELIDWPYDDEIGLLVRQYNKMVKKVEESALLLAQSEREGAWREMAKQVAHEIKNPLTPMKLSVQYLQQALKADQANVKELADNVSKSLIEQIDNLSYIANEFSNFAKMPEAKPSELDLNELLKSAVELYINEQNIEVNFKPHVEPLIVYSDKVQLRRVFTNLLENAMQAIPDDRLGEVNVSVIPEGKFVVIVFADNGKGIDADAKDKIFQPYFTTKSSGTGLGLAMTRKIIESWNGTIWFDTEQDLGTKFYIKLPLVKH